MHLKRIWGMCWLCNDVQLITNCPNVWKTKKKFVELILDFQIGFTEIYSLSTHRIADGTWKQLLLFHSNLKWGAQPYKNFCFIFSLLCPKANTHSHSHTYGCVMSCIINSFVLVCACWLYRMTNFFEPFIKCYFWAANGRLFCYFSFSRLDVRP